MTEEQDFPKPKHPEEKKGNLSRRAVIASIGAGITAASMPQAFHVERLFPPKSDPRNIFEPGVHVMTDEEIKKFLDAFKNGDPDANIWNSNPELVNRLASFTPQVLTVDSVSPSPVDTFDKNWIWQSLPARPRRINQLGVYLVAGDNTYEKIGRFYDNLGGKERGFTLEKQFADKHNEDINHDIHENDNFKSRKIATTLELAIGSVILIAARSALENQEKAEKKARNKRISRRTLLKGTLAGSIMLWSATIPNMSNLLLRMTGPTSAARAENEEKKEWWQNINSYVKSAPDDVWVDGRTAMLIAKHEDSMDYLREKGYLNESAKGAVVMGNGHDAKANLFMGDKEARDEAVLAYGKHILSVAHEFVNGRPGFDELDKNYLDLAILTQLASTDLYHVSDPGIPTGTDLKQYIDSNVKKVDNFRSPQVKNALRSIIP